MISKARLKGICRDMTNRVQRKYLFEHRNKLEPEIPKAQISPSRFRSLWFISTCLSNLTIRDEIKECFLCLEHSKLSEGFVDAKKKTPRRRRRKSLNLIFTMSKPSLLPIICGISAWAYTRLVIVDFDSSATFSSGIYETIRSATGEVAT